MSAIVLMMLAQMGQPMQRWMPNQDNGSLAFFEFAPASGAGMGTTCACTTPTGVKGETMTFTRTGNATCSKQGLATTGIANGDLVVCTANQPRVESSGGVLGLRVEGAWTNSTVRSQQLDNAAWSTAGSTPSAPTITADYATAPDGTTTAERLQFPAVTGGENSSIFESAACPAAAARMTIYVRGVATSGSICLWANDTANATNCAFTNTGWTRCQTTTGGTAASLVLGNLGSIAGCVGANAAQDIVAWGAQCEAGAYATSYIPTVAAAVTRNADSALTGTLSPGVGPSFCLAGSAEWPSSLVTTGVVAQLGTAAPDLASIGRSTNTAASLVINATTTTPAVAAIGTSVSRALLADASGTRSAFWNAGSVAAPAASMTGSPTAVTIGAVDSITTRVQVDPSPSRCTP